MLFAGRAASLVGRVKRVNKALFSDKNLFITNVIISASLSGTGDAIEQRLQARKASDENRNEFDVVRSRHMTFSGIAIGILTHKWYRWLDGRFPGRTLDVVAQKVLWDTLVFSPMQICVFFSAMGLLERTSVTTVKEEILEKGKVLYLFEWMVWVPLQAANFYYLPAQYRVLFDNALSLVYDVFVSYVKFDRITDKTTEDDKKDS